MAASDGTFDKVGNDPVQSGSLLSLLPSLLIHGAVVLAIWLGIFEGEVIQPPVTFISLAPAAAPAPEESPPAPMVPAPDLEPEFEPLPLPETGMVLPQPEPPAAEPEPVLDFTPPATPEFESFPFDPTATRDPEPEPEEAVVIEEKKGAEKPKEPEKPKEKKKEKPKEVKKKEKPNKETKKPAPPPAPEKKPAETPAQGLPTQSAAAPARTAPAAPATPSPNPAPAAISEAPVRVTNPAYAGACPISYPERARKRNQEGTVVVHALIGPDGKPIEVNVARSSGHKLLDEAARDAIADCAFVPQKVGGRAVRAIVEIPIPFKLI